MNDDGGDDDDDVGLRINMLQHQHQQHNIYYVSNDVRTAMPSRDPSRDIPHDAIMTTNGSMDNYYYGLMQQPSFFDVTDTSRLMEDPWMMTSCAADDSGVSLSQPDEWVLGGISPVENLNFNLIAETTASAGESLRYNDVTECVNLEASILQSPGIWKNPNYDVTAGHVTEETTTTPAVENPRYDAIERINAENPGNTAGDTGSDVGSLRFTDEQIVCICLALQQKQDFDKLEEFLSEISLQSDRALRSQISPSSRENCDADTLPVTSRCTVRL